MMTFSAKVPSIAVHRIVEMIQQGSNEKDISKAIEDRLISCYQRAHTEEYFDEYNNTIRQLCEEISFLVDLQRIDEGFWLAKRLPDSQTKIVQVYKEYSGKLHVYVPGSTLSYELSMFSFIRKLDLKELEAGK